MTRTRNTRIPKLFLFLIFCCVILFYTSLSSYGLSAHYRTLSDYAMERKESEIPSHIDSRLIDTIQYATKISEKKHGDSYSEVSVTPLYWHVPKSGGTTVHDRYSFCFRLVEASEEGIIGHETEETLKFVEAHGGKNYINVDTTTVQGIQRASDLGLIPSNMAEIVFSPLFYDSVTQLFSSNHQGQMFAIFRSPIDRIVSLFYYLRRATWEPTYNPEFQDMSLEDYVNSPYVESNYLVRSLVNKMEGPLNSNDLATAKEILRRKCLIGLLHRWDESIDRFDQFFKFQPHAEKGKADHCIEELRSKGGSNVHKHPALDHDDEVYAILVKKNFWDMALYQYIEDLYEQQGHLFNDLSENSR